MSNSYKNAFCPLYFRANGGKYDSKGEPIFTIRIDENGIEDEVGVSGLCSRAYDCGTCSLLVSWVPEMTALGYQLGWECDKCLKETFIEDKEQGVERELPGFFQSSQPNENEPGYIPGCTRCGWPGTFLQLIFRRPRG